MAKGNAGTGAAEKAAAEKAAVQAAAQKAAAQAAAGKADKAVKVKAFSVTASREGFRRAGRAWSKEATVVKLSDLTKGQVAQIKGESLLTVAEVEIDEPAVE